MDPKIHAQKYELQGGKKEQKEAKKTITRAMEKVPKSTER